MPGIVLIGAQWGDEGKGKIIDRLTQSANAVVRFQGGNNAGHTLVVEGQQTVLHLIPSGILHQDCHCIIGNGVVLDPEVFNQEVTQIRQKGLLENAGRLHISERAHLILPFHKEFDHLREDNTAVGKKIGTTKRGIGPCYEDKVGRRGLRAGDLKYPELVKETLNDILAIHNQSFEHIHQQSHYDTDLVYDELMKHADSLLPFVTNTSALINNLINEGKNVMFEGAQGTGLDVDHGTYPYVTSSNTISGAACSGSGIGPTKIRGVIGISKAYCTRVGEGPFPTELFDDNGKHMQDVGHEFGATTGRPRRCGHIDLAFLKHSVIVNGITSLVLTKLDVLSGLPTLKLATSYTHEGKTLEHVPCHSQVLSHCQPVYHEMPGWSEDISQAQSFDDLPQNCQNYIRYIEEFLNIPVCLLSVGPQRGQDIVLKDVWA